MNDADKMREAFEGWFTGEGDTKTRRAMMEKDKEGDYVYMQAYKDWTVWQAATSQQNEVIAELAEALKNLLDDTQDEGHDCGNDNCPFAIAQKLLDKVNRE